ncbi:MAG: hypothetical protein OHK0013_13660 [Sandaracinaceae bacterium]
MILTADALFRAQRDAMALRMHCEDCALFDDEAERCAHGYPCAPHRRPGSAVAERDHPVCFCKDFEAV